MNAAARLVHQHTLTRHLLLTQIFTWRQIAALTLLLAVISSAVAGIYVTHTTRVIHAAYQQQLNEKNRLEIERSQLLLERSTLLVRARDHRKAQTMLGLVTPDPKSIIVVRE